MVGTRGDEFGVISTEKAVIDVDKKQNWTYDRVQETPPIASAVWNRASLTFTWKLRRLRNDSNLVFTVGAMPMVDKVKDL